MTSSNTDLIQIPVMTRSLTRIMPLLAFALSLAGGALAQPVATPHVKAELVSRHKALRAGSDAQIALRLKIIDHWHTYWRNPGDSGLPTRLHWTLPTGFVADPIVWPHPKKLPLGPLMNFGYEGEVLHLVRLQVPANAKPGQTVSLRAKAEWLVCSDVCIPEDANLTLTLPVTAERPEIDSRWETAFANAEAAVPKPLNGLQASAALHGNELQIDVTAPVASPIDKAEFFPYYEGTIANAAKQSWTKTSSGYRLVTTVADPFDAERKSIEGVLVANSSWGDGTSGRAVSISAPLTGAMASARTSLPNTTTGKPATELHGPDNNPGLAFALLLASIGGMLLNLMPCVFPVLGIKVMGFARHSQAGPSFVQKQGIAFLFGVLISFWVLAGAILLLRAAGESIGWGFQLQSPVFVTILAMLFLAMALNLSGVYEIGLRLQTAAADFQGASPRGALVDAFLSGVLATVVATPCTAPAMGAALGYTLSQPAWVAMLVFSFIALGMALPVVLLSFSPALLKRIPKPGPWMSTLKQLMAFPLYATVAWLAWVLGSQTDNDGIGKLLFGLVGIGLAAWTYGHWQAGKPKLAFTAATMAILAAMAISWPSQTAPIGKQASGESEWVPYSAQKLDDLRRQNKAVFVDFTATWCITCQVNKRVALNDEDVRKQFAAAQITRMKADWTLKDPEITRALAAFGRNGVPLYVYYPAGEDGQLLPEILTPSIVLAAITGKKS